eukprot:m.150715 g.150715  ORF g.150715 m.150715 type:complete len:85 (+) comp23323_c0_seq2:1203-1457(+)
MSALPSALLAAMFLKVLSGLFQRRGSDFLGIIWFVNWSGYRWTFSQYFNLTQNSQTEILQEGLLVPLQTNACTHEGAHCDILFR